MTKKTETPSPDTPAPDNAAELAALALEAAALEPEAEPQPGAQSQPETPDVSNADAIKMIVGPAFQIMAPRWQVAENEIEALAQAWGDVADKYLPEGLEIGVELNAAIITLAILGPRLSQPRNDAEAAKRAKLIDERTRQAQAQADAQAAQHDAEAKPTGEQVIDLAAAAEAGA